MRFTTEDEIRAAVVRVAAAEIGPGRVDAYWRDVLAPTWQGPFPKHWCGAFALWCLHQVGLALDVRWKVYLRKGDESGFLLVQHSVGRMHSVQVPRPGDVAYFHAPHQHHAIVERVGIGTLATIDGNQGNRAGTPVRRRTHPFPGKATCFSIAPFVRAYLTSGSAAATVTVQLRPVLRRGDRDRFVGSEPRPVRELQERLRAGLVLDGVFGPKTEAAVKAKQLELGLEPTGVADASLWERLP